MNNTDKVIEAILEGILSGEATPPQKDIFVASAEKSKKLYDAHIKVGFNEEQALAITCALLH